MDSTILIRVVAGVLFVVVSLETGLRALGDRIPAGIATERHDLGEVRKDPRWEDTVRYGRRLRAARESRPPTYTATGLDVR